jgi:hypothetical protein
MAGPFTRSSSSPRHGDGDLMSIRALLGGIIVVCERDESSFSFDEKDFLFEIIAASSFKLKPLFAFVDVGVLCVDIIVVVLLVFCIKSITKLSLSSSLSTKASGLAMSTAFDLSLDSLNNVVPFLFALLAFVNGMVCVVIVSEDIGIVLLLLLFLSNGINFGMTIGAVSHTGLSGGCGKDGEEQVFTVSSVRFDLDSLTCEKSLLGDDGVIRSHLLDVELNDIREGIDLDAVGAGIRGGVVGTGVCRCNGNGKRVLFAFGFVFVLVFE